MNEKLTKISFESLSKVIIINSSPGVLQIEKDSVVFYFKISYKESNNLIVISNGALDLKKKSPPVFQRNSWSDDYDATCIFIDDATIHNSDLATGWGVRTQKKHFIKEYSEIIKEIGKCLNIIAENTIYFGSSAGGLMSLMLAVYHNKSLAIVNNPQVWVRLESQASRVRNLYNHVFPDMSEEEIIDSFGERFSVIETIKNRIICQR